MKDKFLIQINYKSGISVKMWFTTFKINIGSDTKITWTNASRAIYPLYMNVDEIESVYQLKVSLWTRTKHILRRK